MRRLLLVTLLAAVIAAAAILRQNALGLGIGVLAGAAFFLLALARGGGLMQARLPQFRKPGDPPRPPADPDAGIGIALAAAGIATGAVANIHYPYGFRVFYAFCVGAGAGLAVFLAWRNRDAPLP